MGQRRQSRELALQVLFQQEFDPVQLERGRRPRNLQEELRCAARHLGLRETSPLMASAG